MTIIVVKIMQKLPNIGRAEMDILRYVTDHHPVSVREVAEHFAETKGLVRTTILNVMERLRKKGYLARKQADGIYQYSPKQAKTELMKSLVGDFVQKALGGSVSPFVAYLSEHRKLSPEELKELRKLVRELEEDRS